MNCPPGGSHRNIVALCQRSRDISLEKGWLNPDGTDPRPFHTVTSLFHTELSEAFEDIRSNRALNELYYEVKFKESDGTITKEEISFMSIAEARKVEGKYGRGRDFLDAKPCGIPVELADFVIRVAQYYGSAGQGEQLSSRMKEIAQDNADKNAPIDDDAELFITNMHVKVSMAFVFSEGERLENSMFHLATALVTTFAFCRKAGIDLWAAIDEKEAYNRTRPIKHGGKKC